LLKVKRKYSIGSFFENGGNTISKITIVGLYFFFIRLKIIAIYRYDYYGKIKRINKW
tara:strand:+ start:3385 stop:3555 length:171 start_codon:yes stop_codon:yes gene_type:complete